MEEKFARSDDVPSSTHDYNKVEVLNLVINQCKKEKRIRQLKDISLATKKINKRCKTILDNLYDDESTTNDRNFQFSIMYCDVNFIKRSLKLRTNNITIGQILKAMENIEIRIFGKITGLLKIHSSCESGIDLTDVIFKKYLQKKNAEIAVGESISLRFGGDINTIVPRQFCGLNTIQIRELMNSNEDYPDQVVFVPAIITHHYSTRYQPYSLHLNPDGKIPINLCKIVVTELSKATNGTVCEHELSILFKVDENTFKLWLIKNWNTYGFHYIIQHMISDIVHNEKWPQEEPLLQWSYLLWNDVHPLVAKAYLFLYERYTMETNQPEKWKALESYIIHCSVCDDILDYMYDHPEHDGKYYCSKEICQTVAHVNNEGKVCGYENFNEYGDNEL